MQQTAEERRKQRRAGAFHPSVSLASTQDLLTLFDNRLLDEEEIHGRKAWVIESKPQAGRVPANQYETEVLSWSHKLWIDEAENFTLKAVNAVVGGHIFQKPGSTITFEFEKIDDDAWLPVRQSDDFQLQFVRFIRPRGRSD